MKSTELHILEKKIIDYQVEIENLKVKIADVILVDFHLNNQDLISTLGSVHKLSKLIESIEQKNLILEELWETKEDIYAEIEQEESLNKK